MVGGKKRIKDGRKYDKYFSASKQGVINLPKAGVMQTLELIKQLVNETLTQTKLISEVLKGRNTLETSSNIWYFLYENIQYKEDQAGIEQLRTPNRSWADRQSGIDCDCFSIFASSILTNLKIPHSLRITKYNGNDHFQHVYVVVDRNIIIDPVLDKFNYEKRYSEKHDKVMIKHQVLNGIGSPSFGNEFNFLNGASFGNEFNFLNGLGSSVVAPSPKQFINKSLNAIRLYLENTLRIIQTDRGILSQTIKNPDLYEKQIVFVLQNWNSEVGRMKALEKVTAQSVGLGSFWSDPWGSITGTVKKVVKKVKKVVKKVAGAINRKATDVWNSTKTFGSQAWNGIKNVAQKGFHLIKSYNPVSLAIKGALILVMKHNWLGISKKLGHGIISETQARAKGYNMTEWKKVQGYVTKLDSIYVNTLGGDKGSVRKYLSQGSGVGLGVAVSAALVSAASGIIAKILLWIKEVGWTKLLAYVKNGYENVKNLFTSENDPKSTQVPNNPYQKSLPTKTIVAQSIPVVAQTQQPPKKREKSNMLPILVGVGIFAFLATQSKAPTKRAGGLAGVPVVSV